MPNFPYLKILLYNSNQHENYLKGIDLFQLKLEIFYLSKLLFDKNVSEHQNYSKFSQDFNCKIRYFQNNNESSYNLCRFANAVHINILITTFDEQENNYYLIFKQRDFDADEKLSDRKEVINKFIDCCKRILQSKCKRMQVSEDIQFVSSNFPKSEKVKNLNEDLNIRTLQGNSLNSVFENSGNKIDYLSKPSSIDQKLETQIRISETRKIEELVPELSSKNLDEKIPSNFGDDEALRSNKDFENFSKPEQTFNQGLKIPRLIKNENFNFQVFDYNENREDFMKNIKESDHLNKHLQIPRRYSDYEDIYSSKNQLKNTEIEQKMIEVTEVSSNSNKLIHTSTPSYNPMHFHSEFINTSPISNSQDFKSTEKIPINTNYLKIPDYDPKSKPAFNKHPKSIIFPNLPQAPCKTCKALPGFSTITLNCSCTLCDNCLHKSYTTKRCTNCQSPLDSNELQILSKHPKNPF